jgi:hypothetical protein
LDGLALALLQEQQLDAAGSRNVTRVFSLPSMRAALARVSQVFSLPFASLSVMAVLDWPVWKPDAFFCTIESSTLRAAGSSAA